MTDRISHLVVGLDDNIREDEIDAVVTALRMVKRVIDVRPVVADYAETLALMRVRTQVLGRLYDAIDEAFKEQP